MTGLLPTPFHSRTAERNRANAWVAKGRFTVPAHYGDPRGEALAPYFSAALYDVSATDDLSIEGPGAAELLSAACGFPAHGLVIGQSEPVHWCADLGGVRGIGVLSRVDEERFLLRSADADLGWFAAAAPRFEARLSEVTRERGLLFLAGPFASRLLAAVGLEIARLEEGRHLSRDWRDVRVSVFHRVQPEGYELSCAAEEAAVVFDRIIRAGRDFGLMLAGEEAHALLQLEAGLPIPQLDFAPAREPFAREPAAISLGLKAPSAPRSMAPDLRGGEGERVLAGLEFDGEEPLPSARVFSGEQEIGRALRSSYSPALKSAIALAQLLPAYAKPGTLLAVRSMDASGIRETPARVVPLPFL